MGFLNSPHWTQDVNKAQKKASCCFCGGIVLLFKLFITYLAAPGLRCACGIDPSWGMQHLVPPPGIKPGPPHWEHAVPATGPPGQSQSSCIFQGPRAARARSLKGPPTSTGSWGARRASCCSRGLKGPCRSPLGAPTRKFSASHTGPGVQACNEMLGPGGRRVLGAQGLRDLGLSHPAAGPGSLHWLPPVWAQSRIEDTQQTHDQH